MSVGVKSLSKLVSKYSNNHFYYSKKYFTSTSQNLVNSNLNYKYFSSCNVSWIRNKISFHSQCSTFSSTSSCLHYHYYHQQPVKSLTISPIRLKNNNLSKFPLQQDYNIRPTSSSSTSSSTALPENNQNQQNNDPKDVEINNNTSKNNQVFEWIPIYRLKPIKWARLLQRLKIYQTVFSICVITPVSIGCYFTGDASIAGAAFGVGGSAFACGMLLVTGTLASRVVGFMYTSTKDPDVLKVARLDFWGKRKDEIFHVDDFATLAEIAEKRQDKYIPLIRYSDPKSKYYISIQQGHICDLQEFQRVFGPIPRILGDYQIDDSFSNTKKKK